MPSYFDSDDQQTLEYIRGTLEAVEKYGVTPASALLIIRRKLNRMMGEPTEIEVYRTSVRMCYEWFVKNGHTVEASQIRPLVVDEVRKAS